MMELRTFRQFVREWLFIIPKGDASSEAFTVFYHILKIDRILNELSRIIMSTMEFSAAPRVSEDEWGMSEETIPEAPKPKIVPKAKKAKPEQKTEEPTYALTDWESLQRYTWNRGYEIDYTCFELTAENAIKMTNLVSKTIQTQKQRLQAIEKTREVQATKQAEYDTLKKRAGLSTKESVRMDTIAQEIGDLRAKIGKLEKEIEELEIYAKKADAYAKHITRLYNIEKALIEYTTYIKEIFKTETNLFVLMGYVHIYRGHLNKYLSVRDASNKPKHPDSN